MNAFHRKYHPLKKNHCWRARPGCACLVAGQGAVRFDFPRTWTFMPEPGVARIYDRKPPRFTCRLEMRYIRSMMYPSELYPLEVVLEKILRVYEQTTAVGGVHSVRRAGYRLAWGEVQHLDRKTGAMVRSRLSVAIGTNTLAFITLDYYDNAADRAVPAWETLLETLEIGKFMPDPATGIMIDPAAQ